MRCLEAQGTIEPVAVIEHAIVTIVRELSLPSTQERLTGLAGVSVERAGSGVLRCLSERGASRISDLAQSMGVDVSTMSRHVTTLQRSGLAERAEDPLDRRSAHVSLTPAGVDVLELLREARHRYFAELLADWTADDRATLAPLLGRLANEIMDREGRR